MTLFMSLMTMWAALQVSASGRYVATFFRHTVFVYSTERPALPPLKLHHTRVITVST